MDAMTRTEKRERWQEVVAAWEGSGLSQAAFCRERGLCLASFGYWRRRLREAVGEVGFAEVAIGDLAEAAAGSGVRLVVGDGVVVALDVGFDEMTLRRLLQVVGGC